MGKRTYTDIWKDLIATKAALSQAKYLQELGLEELKEQKIRIAQMTILIFDLQQIITYKDEELLNATHLTMFGGFGHESPF